MVTAEGLGKLSGLAVADSAGHLAHCEPLLPKELSRLVHPYLSQVVAEGCSTNLSESSLQLATRRSNPSSNVIKLEVLVVLGLDKLANLLVKVGAITDCAWALCWHTFSTTNAVSWIKALGYGPASPNRS
mgnify:CR=1 FL=1